MGQAREADEEYRAIEALCPDPIELADATALQVRSLTHAKRLPEAIALGLDVLHDLGIAVPTAERLPAELDDQFEYLLRWLDATEPGNDATRAELTDPRLLAGTRVINAILPAAYFVMNPPLVAWLSVQALRIWVDHGPAPTLVGPAAHHPFAAAALEGDYAVSYRVLRRVLALSEARGYEPETSQVRFLLGLLMWWFEPLEDSVDEARRAHEGLISGGDLDNAAYTYCTTMQALLECAPSLDACVGDVEAGLAFYATHRQRKHGRGSPDVPMGDRCAARRTPPQPGRRCLRRVRRHPAASLLAHSVQAMAAAIFGDQAALERHTAEALPLLAAAPGNYPSAVARML